MEDVKIGQKIETKKGITVECVKSTGGCSQCDLGMFSEDCQKYACCPENRKDNKHVVFKQINQKEN